MPESPSALARLGWPVVIVGGAWVAYVAVILALDVMGQRLPSAQVNSVVVGSGVVAAVLATVGRRCGCDKDLCRLREEVREMAERTPQPRVYVASAPVQKPVTSVTDTDPQGLGPRAIASLRNIDRRLNGAE